MSKKAFPVTVMCRVLEVSRTEYYDWCQRPTSARELSNRQLDTHIQAIFIEHMGRYGSPRITEELMDRGITCSENRVVARMKVLELQAKAKRKYKMTTDSNHNKPIASNLLERDFTATQPNEKWTSDITYIWTQGRLALLSCYHGLVFAGYYRLENQSTNDTKPRL